VEECKAAHYLGTPAVILFGIRENQAMKSGGGAYDPEGIVQRAVRTAKKVVPDLLVTGDVCLTVFRPLVSSRRGTAQNPDQPPPSWRRIDPRTPG